MAGAERAQGAALRGGAALGRRPLQDQVPHGRGEARVRADRGGAGHRQAQLPGLRGGLGVEVVLDLHVVRDEADGDHHDGRDALGVQGLQVVADVGFQPRDVRGAAAGLVDELPGVLLAGLRADLLGDDAGDVEVLGDVRAAVAVGGHGAGGVGGGGRDGVRGEGQVRAGPQALGELG